MSENAALTRADLLITNARIYTGDPANPWARDMAVQDGRVLAVGDAADVAASVAAAVSPSGVSEPVAVRDLAGAFVMPGFVDVHNHHALAGKSDLYELSFSLEASLDEVLEIVRTYAAGRDADDWIIGSSWGTGLLGQLSHESARHRLDEAAGGRPVILTDDSHHNRWVSTRALELAGITTASTNPPGGVIVRDPATGAPSGVLLEAACLPVEEAVTRTLTFTAEQHERSSERGIAIAHSYGITAFQDAAISLPGMRALKSLDDQGRLAAWVVSSMTINDQIFGYAEVGDELIAHGEENRSEHHRPDFVKIFLDGVPPAHTGAFLEPYIETAEHGAHFCGGTTMSADELMDWLRRCAEKGLSAKIHCTGDAAVRLVLDAVETLRGDGFTDVRFQIAHGQFISNVDLPRLAELDVSADISPFLWFPGVIADALGAVRPADQVEAMQPNRSLIDSGALVAGGSDWPVSETPNAWEGIQGLVTRADPSGNRPGTLGAAEAITLAEAIAVFTINAATAMGLDDTIGTLEPGKSADFLVLDRNPFESAESALVQTRIDETWFAGRAVFARHP
ncbi:amidohydrolase [Glaciibacter psychrotolerans]|uniref:Amidohydrolase 3 domain-containing protein n=1 Tax=Glaciibacter psychrotolerans TaxID=670054 RepID=A0A7Z0EF10_9MICO|nr:amidohydrolase [Leifsonia psychrotolerans]NYJ20366.1 hypothetical protein [Leifsonia psychrotolerans]